MLLYLIPLPVPSTSLRNRTAFPQVVVKAADPEGALVGQKCGGDLPEISSVLVQAALKQGDVFRRPAFHAPLAHSIQSQGSHMSRVQQFLSSTRVPVQTMARLLPSTETGSESYHDSTSSNFQPLISTIDIRRRKCMEELRQEKAKETGGRKAGCLIRPLIMRCTNSTGIYTPPQWI